MTFGLGNAPAIGSARAPRPAALSDWSIPHGWPYVRLWTLRSLRKRALIIDPTVVIDNRVIGAQQMGLGTGNQHSRSSWLLSKGCNSTRIVSCGRNLSRLICSPRISYAIGMSERASSVSTLGSRS